MSGLNGRVRDLERQQRQAVGCQVCHGQLVAMLEEGESAVDWLDADSCCRGCGTGVKIVPRWMVDKLRDKLA